MNDLIKKLRFKATAVVLNAPLPWESAFVQLGHRTAFDPKTKSTATLAFVTDRHSLLLFLEQDLKRVAADSLLWIAYPKGTSNMKTDINRDSIRATAETFGITTVAAISMDDTWSALRFRPIDKVGT